MAGGNFMGRVMSYLVNELIVDGLANRGYFASKEQGALEKYRTFENRAFQRFAVRTSKKIEDVSNIALKKRQELEEKLKELSQK